MYESPKDILSNNNSPQHQQLTLPNGTTSLVLGIIALVFCIFYGVLAVILGGIGFYLSNKDKALLEIDPGKYSLQSINNHKAGRTCSIIALALGSIFFLGMIIALLVVGLSIFNA